MFLYFNLKNHFEFHHNLKKNKKLIIVVFSIAIDNRYQTIMFSRPIYLFWYNKNNEQCSKCGKGWHN